MKLDDVFTSKEEIATDVKEELTKAMGELAPLDCARLAHPQCCGLSIVRLWDKLKMVQQPLGA